MKRSVPGSDYDSRWDGPETDLGNISRMLDYLNKVVVTADGGVMRMYPGGPDVGLGVGARQRGTKFLKQRDDGSNEYRWATIAEQIVAHYRLTPNSMFPVHDLINWMKMNGYGMESLDEAIEGLRDNDICVVIEPF